MFHSIAPDENCVQHGCRISARLATDGSPLLPHENIPSTEAKRDGTDLSNVAHMRKKMTLTKRRMLGDLPR